MVAPTRRTLRASLLAASLSLGACSSSDFAMPDLGLGGLLSPFMGPTNVVAADSLTVQRVRGGNPEIEPLLPEPGNVWPEAEAPRPTLMGGPDEAFRNIPSYTPSLIQGSPPAQSPVATPGVPRGPVADVTPPARITAEPTSSRRNTTVAPTAGGAVVRDGNVETFIGPDGQTRTRIVTD